MTGALRISDLTTHVSHGFGFTFDWSKVAREF